MDDVATVDVREDLGEAERQIEERLHLEGPPGPVPQGRMARVFEHEDRQSTDRAKGDDLLDAGRLEALEHSRLVHEGGDRLRVVVVGLHRLLDDRPGATPNSWPEVTRPFPVNFPCFT